MKNATREILMAVMAGDRTITEDQAKAVLKLLEGERKDEGKAANQELEKMRPLTIKEAARISGLCTRTVRNYIRRGVIRPVASCGTKTFRVVREDVVNLINGTTVA